MEPTMQRKGLIVAAFVIVLGPPLSVTPGAGGEITVLAGLVSGDFGTAVDTDSQTATVRLGYGDRTRVRLDVGLMRVSSALGITQTPFGPVPNQRRQSRQQSPGPGGPGPDSLPDSSPSLPSGSEWATGASDVRVTLSRQLIGEGAELFRLDVEVQAKVPTADEDRLLGTGEWDYRLGVAAQYRFWTVTGFGGLGWTSFGDPDWAELEDVVDAYAGLERQLFDDKVVMSGWLEGNHEVVAGTGSRLALGLGIRGAGKMGWRAQITAGLGGSAEDFSALLGVSFGVSAPTVGSRRVG